MNSTRTALLLLVAFTIGAPRPLAKPRDDRPNVVMFVVDDLCDWVGAMGHRQAITPHMDALAKSGVMFTNAHAPGVYCAPSRTAIFTGQHASKTGCYENQVYHYDHPELLPLQKAFHESGYATYGAGKLFHHREGYLDRRGWDHFYVRNETLRKKGWRIETWPMAESERDVPFPTPFPASIYNRGKKVTGGLFLEWGAIPDAEEEAMADTRRVQYACDVLKRDSETPFFLAVGLYSPHFPNYAPQKYFDLYDPETIELPPYNRSDTDDLPATIQRRMDNRRRQHHTPLEELGAVDDAIHGYLACVSYADAMLGRVLQSLREGPNADNTLVVFWSDHGYHHGEKGQWGKHTLWERTTNVPFIWSGPGVAEGEQVDETVSLIDLYPTFVELCQLSQQTELDGRSLARKLADPLSSNDRTVYVPSTEPGAYATINKRWRYIHYSDGTEELYDLSVDPNEWHNLAQQDEYSDVIRHMKHAAPASFAAPGTPNTELRLVLDNENFHWTPKQP